MPIITLTTDFGTGSRYVAQMKGVLCAAADSLTLVDLSHEISPQNIGAAARLLEQSAFWYPADTVHLAVIDPGVGTDRPIVAILAQGHYFVGPDNGLFGWLANQAEEIIELDQSKFKSGDTSSTFHGRDIMAPAAVAIAKGAKLSELGRPIEVLETLPPELGPAVSERMIEGTIVEIDRYGNLITNIAKNDLVDAPHDETLRVASGLHETFGLQTTYGDQPPQTLIALLGSDQFVELAIVNGDAQSMLAARVGDTVTLSW